MVKYDYPYGKGGQNRQRCVCSVHFWGDDVSEALDGKALEIEVFMSPDWGLAELKGAVISAVQAKAVELALTLASAADIYIASMETGL